eukprot:3604323-Alexandrium_andersonii.AAC.1
MPCSGRGCSHAARRGTASRRLKRPAAALSPSAQRAVEGGPEIGRLQWFDNSGAKSAPRTAEYLLWATLSGFARNAQFRLRAQNSVSKSADVHLKAQNSA